MSVMSYGLKVWTMSASLLILACFSMPTSKHFAEAQENSAKKTASDLTVYHSAIIVLSRDLVLVFIQCHSKDLVFIWF